MEISGINGNINKNTIENAKNKATDSDFEKSLQRAMDQKDEQQLKKVCKDFEGILLNMMYKEMKATVPKSGLLPNDMGNEIFESMLDDKLLEEASKG
ncbi:MAG: rod-binding protein, partial [Spirochaetes bacterium]|nr:rod-binding protein [Spirochaetota bacterium]